MTSRPASLFIVTITARPTLQLEGFAELGGAYVNCWIDAPGEAEAVAHAEAEVRAADWIVVTVDSVRSVTSKDYADEITGRAYLEQAMIDGVVLVFHTWSLDSNARSDLH
jgi:hypothetical protein